MFSIRIFGIYLKIELKNKNCKRSRVLTANATICTSPFRAIIEDPLTSWSYVIDPSSVLLQFACFFLLSLHSELTRWNWQKNLTNWVYTLGFLHLQVTEYSTQTGLNHEEMYWLMPVEISEVQVHRGAGAQVISPGSVFFSVPWFNFLCFDSILRKAFPL